MKNKLVSIMLMAGLVATSTINCSDSESNTKRWIATALLGGAAIVTPVIGNMLKEKIKIRVLHYSIDRTEKLTELNNIIKGLIENENPPSRVRLPLTLLVDLCEEAGQEELSAQILDGEETGHAELSARSSDVPGELNIVSDGVFYVHIYQQHYAPFSNLVLGPIIATSPYKVKRFQLMEKTLKPLVSVAIPTACAVGAALIWRTQLNQFFKKN